MTSKMNTHTPKKKKKVLAISFTNDQMELIHKAFANDIIRATLTDFIRNIVIESIKESDDVLQMKLIAEKMRVEKETRRNKYIDTEVNIHEWEVRTGDFRKCRKCQLVLTDSEFFQNMNECAVHGLSLFQNGIK